MDANEIARRLEELRDRVREQIDERNPPSLVDFDAPDDIDLGEVALPELPSSPRLDDSSHLRAANELARMGERPPLTSNVPVLGPLLVLVRRLVRPLVQPFLDPYVDRQERFNAEVVRHLNELGEALERRISNVHDSLFARASDSRLLEARLDAALSSYDESLRQRHTVLFDALEEELWALRGMVRDAEHTLADRLHFLEVRFVERAQSIDARFDEKDEYLRSMQFARSSVPEAQLMEVRAMMRTVLDQLERATAATDEAAPSTPGDPVWAGLREWLVDEEYRDFQGQFRGDEAEIAERLRGHVEHFRQAPGPVADLGCGRGEFLEILRAEEIEGVGVEINDADVRDCRERGLDAVHGDLFEWLEARPAASLGGVFLAQVIEHLPPPAWSRFMDLAASRLVPGGVLVLETINPESVFAMSRAYVLDPTHTRPVHPQLMAFFAQRAGLTDVRVHMQAPVPDNARVARMPEEPFQGHASSLALVREINHRLEHINDLYGAPQEYALVARRVAPDADDRNDGKPA